MRGREMAYCADPQMWVMVLVLTRRAHTPTVARGPRLVVGSLAYGCRPPPVGTRPRVQVRRIGRTCTLHNEQFRRIRTAIAPPPVAVVSGPSGGSPDPGEGTLFSSFSSLSSSSLTASVSAVSPSARSFVVGLSVVRATSRNLLPAVRIRQIGPPTPWHSDRTP